jgi:2-amino-4-hydroxy-6-hydroxymethyldihydropteridine diphosphokinase
MTLYDIQAQPVTCYVALGSNLGDSESYLMNGLLALADHSELNDLNVSRFYLSKPHGPQNQPDYINAAVEFKTTLAAEALLDELQKIENENDRLREGVERWGARTLDIDLLFYNNEIIKTNRLIVPHPRICERAFVLYPLRDLLSDEEKGDLKITKKTTLNDCIARLSREAKSEIKEYIIDG